jgi:hypothetical protein
VPERQWTSVGSTRSRGRRHPSLDAVSTSAERGRRRLEFLEAISDLFLPSSSACDYSYDGYHSTATTTLLVPASQPSQLPRCPVQNSPTSSPSSLNTSTMVKTPNAQELAPPPPAMIRPFVSASDLKVTRFLVGSGVMEPSALSNLAALWTPAMLALCVLFSHVLVAVIGDGWPTSVTQILSGRGLQWYSEWSLSDVGGGAMHWLKVSPMLVAPPIVLLACFEMRHRNKFEDEMSRAIGEEDMRNIEAYYATAESGAEVKGAKKVVKQAGTGRKGFWVLEYDGRIIGTMGLDGKRAAKQLDSTVDKAPVDATKAIEAPDAVATSTATPSSPYPLRNRTAKTEVAPVDTLPLSGTDTLHLRRFATSLSFRPVGIEDDLLNYASAFAFSSASPSPAPAAQRIVTTLRPAVQTALLARLVAAGYTVVPKGSELEVDTEGWKAGKPVGMFEKVMNACWPLDLSWRTYVLDKAVWESMQKQ